MTLDRFAEKADLPKPLIHPETAPFWDALAAGELVLQRCSSCGTARYPHAPVCYVCGSFEWEWTPAKHQGGSIAVVARVHRATGEHLWQAHAPYYSGLVDLEEGLRMPARVLCECGAVEETGVAVRAITFESPSGDVVLGFAHDCVRP